jgi:hypothetical protein
MGFEAGSWTRCRLGGHREPGHVYHTSHDGLEYCNLPPDSPASVGILVAIGVCDVPLRWNHSSKETLASIEHPNRASMGVVSECFRSHWMIPEPPGLARSLPLSSNLQYLRYSKKHFRSRKSDRNARLESSTADWHRRNGALPVKQVTGDGYVRGFEALGTSVSITACSDTYFLEWMILLWFYNGGICIRGYV